MKKILALLAIMLLLVGTGLAQTPSRYYIRADSIFMEKGGGNAELILLNGTRSLTGAFLQNTANGRTGFAYAVDSVWAVGDSMKFRRGDQTISLKSGTSNTFGYGLIESLGAVRADTFNLASRLRMIKLKDSLFSVGVFAAGNGMTKTGNTINAGGNVTGNITYVAGEAYSFGGSFATVSLASTGYSELVSYAGAGNPSASVTVGTGTIQLVVTDQDFSSGIIQFNVTGTEGTTGMEMSSSFPSSQPSTWGTIRTNAYIQLDTGIAKAQDTINYKLLVRRTSDGYMYWSNWLGGGGGDPGLADTAADLRADLVPITRTLTINGVSQNLSADRTWSIEIPDSVFYNSNGTLTYHRRVNGDRMGVTFDSIGLFRIRDTTMTATGGRYGIIADFTIAGIDHLVYDSVTIVNQYQNPVTGVYFRVSDWNNLDSLASIQLSPTGQLDIRATDSTNINTAITSIYGRLAVGLPNNDADQALLVRSVTDVIDDGILVRSNNQTVSAQYGYGGLTSTGSYTTSTTGFLQFNAGGANPVNFTTNGIARFSISATGRVTVNELDTDVTAPTTSGTERMAIVDGNGQFSHRPITTFNSNHFNEAGNEISLDLSNGPIVDPTDIGFMTPAMLERLMQNMHYDNPNQADSMMVLIDDSTLRVKSVRVTAGSSKISIGSAVLTGDSLISYPIDVVVANLGTGTPDGTKFLRDDGVWAVPAGGSSNHISTTDNASVQAVKIGGTRATPAANDVAYTSYVLADNVPAEREYGRISIKALDIATASIDGQFEFSVATANTMTAKLKLLGTALAPVTSGGLDLGTATEPFGDLYLADDLLITDDIDFNGDVQIQYSANVLTFVNASEFRYANPLVPNTDNATPLGSTTRQWSDGYWGSGAVQSYDGGNETITHGTGSGGGFTVAGGYFRTAAGTTNESGFRLTSGTNKTTPAGGEVEYDGTYLYFSPSSTRMKAILANNATASNGFLPIGNGTHFTLAALTSTNSSITITNGAGSINLDIASGYITHNEYTPTLDNTLNVAASTAYVCQYYRVGDRVTVFGKFMVDPTATGAVELRISLPIASAFDAEEEVGGTAVAWTVAGESAAITAVVSGIAAVVKFIAVDVTNKAYSFQFSYKVNPT